LFETALGPAEFLAAMAEIELALGRRRDEPRWSARPIDLDLLLFGSLVLDAPGLSVPHPRMGFRRFVIEPAAEIAPDMRHPTILWTLAELRDHLRFAPPYVAIAGAPRAGKSALAADVSVSLGARLLADPTTRQTAAGAAAGPSADALASGPAWQREIELLGLRFNQLAMSGLASPSGGAGHAPNAAIGDYWFDQSLCVAAIAVPAEQAAEFRERWRAAAVQAPRPKLLVLLDAPLDWLWEQIEPTAEVRSWLNRESFAQLRQSIVDRATMQYRGPLLRLDSRQPEHARAELAAAVQAAN
jgi:hypothetical protein